MKRFGALIGLPRENYEVYKDAHDKIWPDLVKHMKSCNMQNYTIFFKDDMLFSYYEYTGTDHNEDMKKLAESEICKRWWEWMKPMQRPISTRKEGEWWAEMEEAFHMD